LPEPGDFAARDEVRVFSAFDCTSEATSDVASEEGITFVFSRYGHHRKT
jgi:hypothetical protein